MRWLNPSMVLVLLAFEVAAGPSQRGKCVLECFARCMQSGTVLYINPLVSYKFENFLKFENFHKFSIFFRRPFIVTALWRRLRGFAVRLRINCYEKSVWLGLAAIPNTIGFTQSDVAPPPTLVSSEYLNAHNIRVEIPAQPHAFAYIFEYSTIASKPEEWFFAGASTNPSITFTVLDPCRDYQFRVILLLRSADPENVIVVFRPRSIPVNLPLFTIEQEQISVEAPRLNSSVEMLKIYVKWTLPRGFSDSDVYGYESPALYPVQCRTPEYELPQPKIEIVRAGGRLAVSLPSSVLESRCRLWVEVRMLPRCVRLEPFSIQKSIEIDCNKTPNLEICSRDENPTCIQQISVKGEEGRATINWTSPEGRTPLYYHVRYGPAQIKGVSPFVSWQLAQRKDVRVDGSLNKMTVSIPEDQDYGVQVCAVMTEHRKRPKFAVANVTPFQCSGCSGQPTPSIPHGRCGECGKIEGPTVMDHAWKGSLNRNKHGEVRLEPSLTTKAPKRRPKLQSSKFSVSPPIVVPERQFGEVMNQTVFNMEADMVVAPVSAERVAQANIHKATVPLSIDLAEKINKIPEVKKATKLPKQPEVTQPMNTAKLSRKPVDIARGTTISSGKPIDIESTTQLPHTKSIDTAKGTTTSSISGKTFLPAVIHVGTELDEVLSEENTKDEDMTERPTTLKTHKSTTIMISDTTSEDETTTSISEVNGQTGDDETSEEVEFYSDEIESDDVEYDLFSAKNESALTEEESLNITLDGLSVEKSGELGESEEKQKTKEKTLEIEDTEVKPSKQERIQNEEKQTSLQIHDENVTQTTRGTPKASVTTAAVLEKKNEEKLTKIEETIEDTTEKSKTTKVMEKSESREKIKPKIVETSALKDKQVSATKEERPKTNKKSQKCMLTSGIICEFGCETKNTCRCSLISHILTPSGGCIKKTRRQTVCLPKRDINATWDPITMNILVRSPEVVEHAKAVMGVDKLFLEFGEAKMLPGSDMSMRLIFHSSRHKMVAEIKKLLESGIFSRDPFIFHVNETIDPSTSLYGMRLCTFNSSAIEDPYTHAWDKEVTVNGSEIAQVVGLSPVHFTEDLSGRIQAGPNSFWTVFTTIAKIAILVVLGLIMMLFLYLNCTRIRHYYDNKRTHYFQPYYLDSQVHVSSISDSRRLPRQSPFYTNRSSHM